jgi:hypothetical protein
MWERVDSGYRVLDWEAVEVCLDRVRQIRGEDPQALAWERDREAKIRAHMAKPILVTPPCAACGTPSARIELVTPGQLPAEWEQWPSTVQGNILRRREPGQWYLLVQSITTHDGYGDPIDARRAGRSPGRSGLPCASPRSAQPGSTTMQESARTATPLLLPTLAPVRHRIRLLPPRAQQEPGPALVAVNSQSPDAPDW